MKHPQFVCLMLQGRKIRSTLLTIFTIACGGLSVVVPLGAQDAPCSPVPEHELSAAAKEYEQGRYPRADDLYGAEVQKHPEDAGLSAAYVSTLLHEGEVDRALTQVNRSMSTDPHSAVTLTALAQVLIHEGQPWQALETLKSATAADRCYARIHLVRSEALRLDSMYASEREEVQQAYLIDPNDPDIKHAWLRAVNPAREIEGIAGSLETMKDLDADVRRKAQDSINEMMPLLLETSQTCKVLPTANAATIPLTPMMLDPKHVDGYKLDAEIAQSRTKLVIDTGASGLFISRAFADQNGFKPGDGDPPGTVHVDHLKIGPLEFGNCLVGVSETPFPGKGDGYIGTDIFSSYLITLDHPHATLVLDPLPKAGLLPGDRLADNALPAELKGFMPVYHRQQYLLVPALLDGKAKRLFILDSGIRFSTMRPDVAHLVSTTKVNFTNPVQTVSGSTLQVYRDSFDFQLANLTLPHQSHILEMDTSAIDQHSGLQIAGMLGFDMLHSFVMHLDYRDGLVKLESQDAGVTSGRSGSSQLARNSAGNDDCKPEDDRERPLGTTLEAKVTGLIDSARLKPGSQVLVSLVKGWSDDECQLEAGTNLYGHVVVSSSTRNPESSELSLVFDHGECFKGGKKQLALRLIGLSASPDQFVALHTVLPSEVGGVRSIANLAGSTALWDDSNLNPGGPSHTIRPGLVMGMPKVKLEPLGGPECSAKITSSEKSIHFGVGAEMIFTRQTAR